MSETPETDAIFGGMAATDAGYWKAVDLARKLERERDEARHKLADWEDSAKHVRSEWPDEQHCSCVPILRKLLKDAESERDQTRVALAERDKEWFQIIESFAGFHPASMTDALKQGIENAKKQKAKNAKLRDLAERILLNCETLHPNTVKIHRAELDQLKEGGK